MYEKRLVSLGFLAMFLLGIMATYLGMVTFFVVTEHLGEIDPDRFMVNAYKGVPDNWEAIYTVQRFMVSPRPVGPKSNWSIFVVTGKTEPGCYKVLLLYKSVNGVDPPAILAEDYPSDDGSFILVYMKLRS